MSNRKDWIEMTDIFTEEGIAKLEKDQVLRFDYEGSVNEYKIMRIKHNRVWVKPVTLVDPDDPQAMADAGFEPHTTKDVTDPELL